MKIFSNNLKNIEKLEGIYEQIEVWKKSEKLNNSDMGAIIGKSGDAFRMAVKRQSLSELEIEKLEQKFTLKSILSDSVYEDDLKKYEQGLEHFRLHTREELIELSYKFLANKEKIYKLGIVNNHEETRFWIRYYDIIKEHGSMENYLNKKI